MTDKLSEYGWSFQIKVLAAMFVDRTFLQQIADIIQPDYFESDANSWLMEVILDHFREYKTPPTKDVLKVKVTSIENDVLKTAILEQLKEVFRYMESDDLTFVKDTCAGFEEIYNSEFLFGEVTNIGMKAEISIGDLAKLIAGVMNVELSIKSTDERIRPKNSEVERLFCDNAQLLKHTSWMPKYTLEQGISKVIEWMKKPVNLNYFKSDKYNV